MLPVLESAVHHMSAASSAFLLADRPLEALKDVVACGSLFDAVLDQGLSGYDARTCLAESLLRCVAADRPLEMIAQASEECPVGQDDLKEFVTVLKILFQSIRSGLLALIKLKQPAGDS
jgi:hypothetical protein